MPASTVPPSPALALRGVRLRRQQTEILRGLDWSVPRGAYAAVLGPNGAGKTLLIRVVCGYEWVTDGVVEVLGERLGQTDVRALRRRIGLVNPSAHFGVDARLTATQAVLTGLTASLDVYDDFTPAQVRHAEDLLDAVGLAHRRRHAVGLLSTGEQRRCLVARALVRLPELLILDEPTAGLDVAARERLLATIERLHQRPDRPTILIVTHHVEELSPACAHVLLLKDGQAFAQGPPGEVLTAAHLGAVLGCTVHVHRRNGRYWLEVPPQPWDPVASA